MPLSRLIGSEADMRYVSCYEEVEYKRVLWGLIEPYSGRDVPDISPALVVLCLVLHVFYRIDRLDYFVMPMHWNVVCKPISIR